MVLREKDDANYYANQYESEPTQKNLDQLIKYRPQDHNDAINKKAILDIIRSEKKQKSILDFYETTIQYVKISDIEINERIRGNLNKSQVNRLSESINQIGLINPITITKKKVLVAGNHRLHACKKIGWNKIPCVITTIEDSALLELQEIDENLIRYELHFIDRGNHLKRRKEIYEEMFPETISVNVKGGPGRGHKTNALGALVSDQKSFVNDTSQKTGIAKRTIAEDIQIVKNTTPEIQEQIKENSITKKEAIKLAQLEPKQQKKVLEKIKKKEAKQVTQAITQIRKEETPKTIPKLPEGEYNVIYADPPWFYKVGNITPNRIIENQYPSMQTEDICKMKVPSAKDTILFLWVTSPKLEEGLKVLNSWGFEYKTSMVWVKDRIGMGYYVRGRHEFLLIGTKGKPPKPSPKNRYDSVIEAPRTKHSKKPNEVYERIEKMYPDCKYLELFARDSRENWKSWGDEI